MTVPLPSEPQVWGPIASTAWTEDEALENAKDLFARGLIGVSGLEWRVGEIARFYEVEA